MKEKFQLNNYSKPEEEQEEPKAKSGKSDGEFALDSPYFLIP